MQINTTVLPAGRLLDQVRDKIRFKHDNSSTENSYVSRIKQYTLFNGKRHPANRTDYHAAATPIAHARAPALKHHRAAPAMH